MSQEHLQNALSEHLEAQGIDVSQIDWAALIQWLATALPTLIKIFTGGK